MSKPDTWMPLYIGDYIADTMHLNTEQHGAYLLLLMTAWNRGGKLPGDESQLALICRADKKTWARIRDVVLPFFVRLEDGSIVQQRLLEEYERAVKLNEKQKANGAKGGRPRKTQTESQEKPTGFIWDNPNHNPNETPSPSPSASQIPKGVNTANASVDSAGVTPAGLVCARLKSECRISSGINPQHPKLLALLASGMTADELVSAGMDANGKGFAWVLATAEGRRRDAASAANLPSARASPRISHADASKLAAARAIFGTEIEGESRGTSERVVNAEPVARLVGG